MFSANLSANGMQIVCPEMRVWHLVAELDTKAVTAGIQVSKHQRVDVQCSVAYVSEAADEILIGLHFEQFVQNAKQAWFDFIEAAVGPDYLLST